MHELTATQAVLDAALQHAGSAGGGQIIDIYLVLGEGSSITEAGVRFYWQQISPGTLADAARLHFRAASAVWACLECGHQEAMNAKDLCPSCGSHRLKAGAGHDFYLEALDVETRPAHTVEG